MSVTDELERLAKLRADGALTADEFERAKNQLLTLGPLGALGRGIRRQSKSKFYGLPLWEIALGPDLARGEFRGHARAIFALGDMATGWFAFGGLARGIVAVGGLALGVISFGGGAIGILVAFGGAAIGTVAIGGGAVGLVAVGGGAFGYYACGGGAAGVHTLSALRQDPEAINFFKQFVPSWMLPHQYR
jgi:hypothetical protein